MKKIFFILSIILIFASPLFAGELYSCKDSQGNSIVTSAPQDGMTDCVLKDSYEDLTPQQRIAQQKEIQAERQRLNAQADKYYSNKRQQEERNRRADKLLQTVKDNSFNLPRANREMLDASAESKAEQIRQGTDTPMTAQEDADFHTEQRMRDIEWKQQDIEWKQQDIEWKQRDLEREQQNLELKQRINR